MNSNRIVPSEPSRFCTKNSYPSSGVHTVPGSTPRRGAHSSGIGSSQCTPISNTTRAARIRWASSIPIRSPGSCKKPNSSMSRSAYRAQPSPWPEVHIMFARHLFMVFAIAVATEICRWCPGTPSWYTVDVSRQVAKVSSPSGTDHHMRPGREKSGEGPV